MILYNSIIFYASCIVERLGCDSPDVLLLIRAYQIQENVIFWFSVTV